MKKICTENLDMPACFRVELSQFMLLIRSNTVEEIQKMGEQYDMGE